MRRILFLLLLLPVFSEGQIITTVAGNGTPGYTGDGGQATLATLNSPDNIKFDHSGNLYIADEYNHVIRKINTSGIITTVAGTGIGGYTGDGGPATNAELKRPLDLTFDAAGNLYIAEYGNHIIRRINTSGIITTIAGTGTAGYNGDGILAITAQLYDPFGLVFDASGYLYFSDNGNYRVRKISPSGIITTVAGTGIAGYNGDGIPATAAQVYLTGYISFSPIGELYLADYANHRIRKIDGSGIITTIVGNGTPGNTGDGGPASAATVTSSFAIIFDQAGNMYISDRSDEVIRKVNTAGIITTIAGNGTSGYGGDGGPAIAAEFNIDVVCGAVDATGNLYIADPLNNRIRKITYTTLNSNALKTDLHNISIFPNPATASLTITAPNTITNITITNLIGQTIYSRDYNANSVAVDVADFPVGVYFVKINGMEVRRFVKE